MMIEKRKAVLLGLALIVVTAVISSTATYGLMYYLSAEPAWPGRVEPAAGTAVTGDQAVASLSTEEGLPADFKALLPVYEVVRDNYVDEDRIDPKKLAEGAIRGMVAALDDPYSTFMNPEQYKSFNEETFGTFGGVGIYVTTVDGVLTVIAPIDGSPGQRAGLKSGDKILKVDGKDISGLSDDEAIALIKGEPGTEVTLTIAREGEGIKDYTLTREMIDEPMVSGKMLGNNIGYIRITMFDENCGADFAKKLKELENQGMKGLIVDVRDNPGGLLDEVVKIARLLVPKGPIVSTIDRFGNKKIYSSVLPRVKFPLVVLVNEGSASASEILAGAVKDTAAGILVGQKTFGKGSVQTMFEFPDGSAVKLTVEKYYTPSGKSIHGIGIEPDVTVDLPPPAAPADEVEDTQLQKAIELLQDRM